MQDTPQDQLEVVDEQGAILRTVDRGTVHREGLLHREIHVWIINDKKELAFQHRAKDKDTFPDKLDVTVGGHVDPGESYLESAVREVAEETALQIAPDDLTLVDTIHRDFYDSVTHTRNNVLDRIYLCQLPRPEVQLQVEKGKAVGFEWWPIRKLSALTESEQQRFIADLVDKRYQQIYEKILQLHADHS